MRMAPATAQPHQCAVLTLNLACGVSRMVCECVAFLADSPPPPELADSVKLILHFLGTKWSGGRHLTVLQAMNEAPGISNTTAHRRLKILRSKGFITFEMDESDNRVKYVLPTEKALAYFTKMGELLIQASRASS
jgi:hypothetical protein